ncbi:YncE family protein, partial [Tepidimonas sp.]|uniref:YncE family protein n=1 Tax=Tepidimonas sp. TaxID=2002775 RepID=UPI00391B81CB
MHTNKKSIVTAIATAFVLGGCAATATAPKSAEVKWPNVIVHLHGGNGKAYLVDPATDSVVATLDTEKSAGLGATTPDGRKVYVGAEGEGKDTVTVIDLDKRAVVAKIKTGNRPKHPVVSPNGKLVMVNHWGLDGGKLRVTFIDTATDKVVKNVDLDVRGEAKGPTSMHNAWSYDSRYAFTVDRVDDHFVIIDTSDWSVKKIKMPSKPHYVVPSPDGKEV